VRSSNQSVICPRAEGCILLTKVHSISRGKSMEYMETNRGMK